MKSPAKPVDFIEEKATKQRSYAPAFSLNELSEKPATFL